MCELEHPPLAGTMRAMPYLPPPPPPPATQGGTPPGCRSVHVAVFSGFERVSHRTTRTVVASPTPLPHPEFPAESFGSHGHRLRRLVRGSARLVSRHGSWWALQGHG